MLMWEAEMLNAVQDQMTEDDQSTLNFFLSTCNLGWYCFHELLEISLAN